MPLRRADRLFDIIQLLRTASRPVTAAALATKLEVTPRTIYRDVATLQARRVPIEGAPGLGYLLRRGFELPPLMFTREEIEAILVGARLLRRTGDVGLQDAAARVLSKVEVVLPEMLRDYLTSPIAWVARLTTEVSICAINTARHIPTSTRSRVVARCLQPGLPRAPSP